MIYEKISELCVKKGITIGLLERQAGLGNGTIRRWKTSSPTIENLQSVATVLKVKVSKLVE